MKDVVLLMPLGLFASLLTYQLRHKYQWNLIRASVLPTLFFCTIALIFEFPNYYQALFFGATFVGMSSDLRLGKIGIIFSSLLFIFLFSILVDLIKGPGGVLGTIAFISTSLTWITKKWFLRITS